MDLFSHEQYQRTTVYLPPDVNDWARFMAQQEATTLKQFLINSLRHYRTTLESENLRTPLLDEVKQTVRSEMQEWWTKSTTQSIDANVPLPVAGENALIVGDARAGKTNLLMQTVLSQYRQDKYRRFLVLDSDPHMEWSRLQHESDVDLACYHLSADNADGDPLPINLLLIPEHLELTQWASIFSSLFARHLQISRQGEISLRNAFLAMYDHLRVNELPSLPQLKQHLETILATSETPEEREHIHRVLARLDLFRDQALFEGFDSVLALLQRNRLTIIGGSHSREDRVWLELIDYALSSYYQQQLIPEVLQPLTIVWDGWSFASSEDDESEWVSPTISPLHRMIASQNVAYLPDSILCVLQDVWIGNSHVSLEWLQRNGLVTMDDIKRCLHFESGVFLRKRTGDRAKIVKTRHYSRYDKVNDLTATREPVVSAT